MAGYKRRRLYMSEIIGYKKVTVGGTNSTLGGIVPCMHACMHGGSCSHQRVPNPNLPTLTSCYPSKIFQAPKHIPGTQQKIPNQCYLLIAGNNRGDISAFATKTTCSLQSQFFPVSRVKKCTSPPFFGAPNVMLAEVATIQ